MSEKTITSRIINKHDTAENWGKATGFIPKKGEVIVYDIDTNYTYERIKIGDGKTVVSSLPFVDDALRTSLLVEINAVDDKVDALDVLVGDTAVATQISNAVANKADVNHTHDNRYYTETEINTKLAEVNTYTDEQIADLSEGFSDVIYQMYGDDLTDAGAPTIRDIANDEANAVQSNLDVVSSNLASHTGNKSNPHGVTLSQLGVSATATELNYVDGVTSNVQTQLNAKVPTSRTINGKALSANITLSASDIGADASGSANTALTSAKDYTDAEIAEWVGDTKVSEQIINATYDVVRHSEQTLTADQQIQARKNLGLYYSMLKEEELLPATSVTVSNKGSGGRYGQAPSVELVVGNTYRVVYDGVTYECVCENNAWWQGPGLGVNDSYKSCYGQSDGVYPFCYSWNSDGSTTYLSGTSGNHTISITLIIDIKKIDEEYLPDPLLATALKNTRYIDGVSFTGADNVTRYATCYTSAATVSKEANLSEGTLNLTKGARVTVEFRYANTASSPTLNISSTGDKAIYWHGATLASSQYWKAGAILDFVYNGSQWELIGVANDNDTTYSAATTSTAGLMSASDKSKLDGIAAGANNITVDSALSETSTNPVQNKIVSAAISNLNTLVGDTAVATQISNAIADKSDADHTHTASEVGADASGSAASALASAKSYTDTKISDLINSAPTTLDTLGEIATAMEENADVVSALETAVGTKASASDLTSHTSNKSNPHGVTLSQLGVSATATELNYVDGVTSAIQTQLNAKVPTSRTVNGKALSANITLSASDVGADASGAASTALTNAKAYTDAEIQEWVGDDTVADQISAAIATKADSSHTHSAYVNQNAFSNVTVGSTTIAADSTTDTLTLVAGSNVTITPDATNDKITIAATDTVYTHPSYTARTGVPTANQTPAFGGTFSVSQPVSDATGHITAVNSRTVTIPSTTATTSAAGLMSASDKSKLDGIATGANKITVDSALSSTSTNPVQNKVVNTAISSLNVLVGDTSVAEQIEAAQIVYVGPTEPTDSRIKVWINTAEDGTGVVPVLPRITMVSMPTSGWTGASSPYSQVVTVNTVTSATKVDLQPTLAQIMSLQDAGVTTVAADNTNGTVTVYAFGNKPTSDVTMQALLMEVSYV